MDYKLPAVHSTHFHILPDKIEAWGMCSEGCQPPSGGFSFANLNLLTDEECGKLVNPDIGVNFDTELCAGPHLWGCLQALVAVLCHIFKLAASRKEAVAAKRSHIFHQEEEKRKEKNGG